MRDNVSGLAAMLWPAKRRRVNFTNPVNGRLWLRLLAPDPRHGLRFHPDLRIGRRELGFSFTSNRFGLRGPDNARAPNVLLGTSFAMGLSVDNGENWYEQLLDPAQWFNGAMPVGPHNQIALLEDLYSGPADTLLYLYHPNIWKTAQGYLTATARGRDIFEVMRWKSDMSSVARLFPKWIAKELTRTARGASHYRRINGKPYFFNAAYCRLDLAECVGLFDKVQAGFDALFTRFQRVILVRVPIKEEIAARHKFSSALTDLAASYDEFWTCFVQGVPGHVQTVTLPQESFTFDDFLPFDTHWSSRGNRTFARLLRPILDAAGVSGVKPDGGR